MSPFQTYSARLIRSTPLSELTRHLEFEMPASMHFGFVPGQWLSFKALKVDGEELTRAYSLASPPGDNTGFALCLNRVQDGFMSNFLCNMNTGDEIQCQGPFGDFILHPPMRDTIFIATGTGVAPFRSMLHWLLADESRHQQKQLWLFFGSRYEKDLYYHDEFLRLSSQHPNFRYLPTLSRGSMEWRGLRGYVQEHVPGITDGRAGMHAYICGLDKMVKANRELLTTLGWESKSIRCEKYD